MQLAPFIGQSYPAVAIQDSFSAFLGESDNAPVCHADVFRHGNPQDLAKLMSRVGAHLESLGARADLAPEDQRTVDRAASNYRRLANAMAMSTVSEPDNYAWVVVADLLESLEVIFSGTPCISEGTASTS